MELDASVEFLRVSSLGRRAASWALSEPRGGPVDCDEISAGLTLDSEFMGLRTSPPLPAGLLGA